MVCKTCECPKYQSAYPVSSERSATRDVERSVFTVSVFYTTSIISFTGEKKLGRVICPDPWKSGARNTIGKGQSLWLK